ncbi:hypothetical protein, partial [Streptomyces mirabilis]|uniref:hypothetical protein n=1 Tax=Streptomyces mirabilis TaxID=68239 RepID=UPI0034061382
MSQSTERNGCSKCASKRSHKALKLSAKTGKARSCRLPGVYMEASFALSGTLQVLKQKGLLVDPKDKKHV